MYRIVKNLELTSKISEVTGLRNMHSYTTLLLAADLLAGHALSTPSMHAMREFRRSVSKN